MILLSSLCCRMIGIYGRTFLPKGEYNQILVPPSKLEAVLLVELHWVSFLPLFDIYICLCRRSANV